MPCPCLQPSLLQELSARWTILLFQFCWCNDARKNSLRKLISIQSVTLFKSNCAFGTLPFLVFFTNSFNYAFVQGAVSRDISNIVVFRSFMLDSNFRDTPSYSVGQQHQTWSKLHVHYSVIHDDAAKSELSMGWVGLRVGLDWVEIFQFSVGWVGLGRLWQTYYILWELHYMKWNQPNLFVGTCVLAYCEVA